MAAALRTLFSTRHMLMLSLALNLSLMLKMIEEKSSPAESLIIMEKLQPKLIAEVSPSESTQQGRFEAPQPHFSAQETGDTPDDEDSIVNLDHGDPTMYENYWQQMGDRTTVVIPGWQFTSYFSVASNLCWFLEPELANEIIRLHGVVGNAITDGRHIVVGTGSSQLYQAALYAYTSSGASEPVTVVSAAPYYSSYPTATDCVKSSLFRWGGDARVYDGKGPYIELVTSPNNPDGFVRDSVVNRSGGILIHDLAYYWPHYTPITSPANHELTLFTVSKTTGHAGSRIGWALVKDPLIAKKMVKYIEVSTIGVSKDSQVRAAKVLKVVSDGCEGAGGSDKVECLFRYSHSQMTRRWMQLREAVKESGVFSLPEFSPRHCNFLEQSFGSLPAFAWLKCEDGIEDCESFLRRFKIVTRGGRHFGVGPSYVRVSMLDRDRTFNLFVRRLSKIHR
ncbi:hypothetical protein MLD38_027924 [Melastoma candidum]|uniref:Uncharacterized protein n=1 Tax=Melastoma candidum TaxID=119954 RepID=A0ACB9MZB7_9MYRT|nr:hypothetical protein MLD38_027924 [Melastoma candidum]